MQPYRKVIAIVTAWKVILTLLFALSVYSIAPNPSHVGMSRVHPFILKATASWDGGWYSAIASEGYGDVPNPRFAFFPLFPELMRAVHATGVGYFLAGLLLSNVAFVIALTAFHALTRDVLGAERELGSS